MPRNAVLAVLERWDPQRNNLEDLLEQPLRQLAPRDAALARHLAEAIIRHLRMLDHWINKLAVPDGRPDRAGRQIEPDVRNLLRLGLAQLRYSRIPVHAAVDTSANLAPDRARGFVNALLRRAAREPETLDAWEAAAAPPVRYSLAGALWRHWVDAYGDAQAELMARASQDVAPLAFFLNDFHPRASTVLADPAVQAWPGQAGYFRYDGILPRDWLAAGMVCVQDPAANLATGLLAPLAGERVLDACAAPGGKTLRLALMAKGAAEIVATDLAGPRLERLAANVRRLLAQGVEVRACDWNQPMPELGLFDAVLVDAPCTNTGVLRRRLDARYRFGADTLAHALGLQSMILDACAGLVKPGGRLVYSTCSMEPEENQRQVEAFLQRHAGWQAGAAHQTFTHRDGIDSHFAARLERAAV